MHLYKVLVLIFTVLIFQWTLVDQYQSTDFSRKITPVEWKQPSFMLSDKKCSK